MTLREKVAEVEPKLVDDNFYYGGVSGCPYKYNYLHASIPKYCGGANEEKCSMCWNREYAPAESDNVEHPEHYASGSIECIDAMIETQGIEAVKNFCICNAFKYLWRHGKKNGVEDVKKASWYLNKFIELEEKKDEN